MKRRAFGWVPPTKNRAFQKERMGAQKLEAQRREHDSELANVQIKKTTDAVPSLAERIGLGVGEDLDAEMARRKEAAIQDPRSFEMAASQKRARDVAERYGLSPEIEALYAVMLRTTDPPRKRQTAVATANTYRSQRVERVVETTGSGGPPDGFAHYYPANVPLEAILGLPLPGLPPMLFPLTQAPAGISPQQRAEAAQRQKAHDSLDHSLP